MKIIKKIKRKKLLKISSIFNNKNDKIYNFLKSISKIIKSKNLNGVLNIRGYTKVLGHKTIFNETYDIQNENLGAWYRKNAFFMEEIDTETDFNFEKINYTPFHKVDKQKKNNKFRLNNMNNCFFKAIYKYINTKKNDNGIINKNIKTVENKLKKIEEDYTDGVNEDDIQKIVNNCNIKININDPLNKKWVSFQSEKKPVIVVNLINSKIDHLILNSMYCEKMEYIYTQEDMKNILIEHLNNDKFFNYFGSNGDIYKIISNECEYIFKDKQNEKIKEFNIKYDIYKHSIDIIKDENIYNYIKNGVIYSNHCLINEDPLCCNSKDYIELDIKKAYLQYKKNLFYIGYPSVLCYPVLLNNNWDYEKYAGYYKIKILSFDDDNTRKIFNKLNIYEQVEYILTSIDLLHFKKWGITFNLISGCYSMNSFDLELDELSEDRIYCKYAGKLNMVSKYSTLKFIETDDTAKLLKSIYDDIYINNYIDEDIKYINGSYKEIIIRTDKKCCNYYGHIGGFITAYTRTTTIDRLLKYKYENIIGYKLDGFILKNVEDIGEVCITDKTPIFHRNLKHNENSIFTVKRVLYKFNWSYEIYNSIHEHNFNEIENEFKEPLILYTGVGGSGKTSIICGTLKLNPLFIGGNWKLITDKIMEYGINGNTINKLIGIKCEKYDGRHPRLILLDECNTYSKEWIKMVIEYYKYSQIIMLGDFDKKDNILIQHQLSNVSKDIINIEFLKEYGIIEKKTNKNYRCKCEKLLSHLNNIRDYVINNYENEDLLQDLKYYVLEYFRKIKIEDLIKEFNYKTDIILCSITNTYTTKDKIINEKLIKGKTVYSETDYYTELLNKDIYKCVKHGENAIYNKLNNGDGHLQGEILIGDYSNEDNFKKQNAFTIHSFQGLTIRGTLYIDLKKCFDFRQIYTSLSRVSYYEQIKIIV